MQSKLEELFQKPELVTFGLLTTSALVVAAWFGWEEILLSKGERPLTWYTRRLVNKNWAVGRILEGFAMFTIGVAVTHFIIDSDHQPVGT